MTCTATKRWTEPVRTVRCERPADHPATDGYYVVHVAHVQDGITINTYTWSGR